jgi:hypothetical protein
MKAKKWSRLLESVVALAIVVAIGTTFLRVRVRTSPPSPGDASVQRKSTELSNSSAQSSTWASRGRALGSAWNGGKPGIPVEISSDLPGPIPAGVNFPVILSITIDQECTGAEVRLRGLDGVLVLGQHRVDLGVCRPGERLGLSTTVRIPSGGAGFLAVDVTVEEVDEDGVSVKRSASRAISVVAEGARPKPRSIGKSVPAGKSGNTGREDERVIELGR